MNSKALDAVYQYQMFEQGDLVCAAVSGGADSVALLHFLLTLRDRLGLRVTVCHLNHNLRGAEADRDEAFVRQLCSRWQLPLTVESLPVADLARQQGLSEETAGRQARYDMFARLHRDTGCKVATAHTLSDNMETVLFRMARGAGLRGMQGILPVRDYICRPLITCTRQEVEAYCAAHGLDYVQDSTNFLPDYTRNRIRMELVPRFYELNPAADQAFLHLTRAMGESYALVRQQAEAFLAEQLAGDGSIPAQQLTRLLPVLQREVLADMAAACGGSLSERQTALCRELAARGGVSEIGGGVRFVSRRGRCRFEPVPPAAPAEWELPLTLQQLLAGPVLLPDGRRLFTNRINPEQIANFGQEKNLYLKNTLDCGKIYGNIVLRSRRPGDRLCPVGRGVTKTLKKLLNEAGIPPRQRSTLAVLADQAGVLWVEGFGCDARAAAAAALPNDDYITIGIEGKTK